VYGSQATGERLACGSSNRLSDTDHTQISGSRGLNDGQELRHERYQMLQAVRVRTKEYHRKRPTAEVLLELDLVDRDEGIAAIRESVEQRAVVQIRTAEEATDRRDVMGG
jgi:hypothetical protein